MGKLVKWLNKSEAKALGLKVKENARNRNQNRYYLTQDQFDFIYKLRTTPSKRKFVETIKKLDKKGEVISTTEKLQSTRQKKKTLKKL